MTLNCGLFNITLEQYLIVTSRYHAKAFMTLFVPFMKKFYSNFFLFILFNFMQIKSSFTLFKKNHV